MLYTVIYNLVRLQLRLKLLKVVENQLRSLQTVQSQLNRMTYVLHFFKLNIFTTITITCRNSIRAPSACVLRGPICPEQWVYVSRDSGPSGPVILKRGIVSGSERKNIGNIDPKRFYTSVELSAYANPGSVYPGGAVGPKW